MAKLRIKMNLNSFLLNLSLFLFLVLFFYCKPSNSVHAYLEEPYPEKLSDWKLFIGNISELKPNDGVLPYDLNMPLFTDYASKSRFIWMPKGKSAQYKEEGTFVFPTGTVISKTFYFEGAKIEDSNFPKQLVETRLLVNSKTGWIALPYIWNKEMTDARLEIVGSKQTLTYKSADGKKLNLNYIIPNTNQCLACHGDQKQFQPIGPKAKNLNRLYTYSDGEENQLLKWKKLGYLTGLTDIPTTPSFPNFESIKKENLREQARAYLDVNCAHCHNPEGVANTSGLMLNYEETNKNKIGFCKTPVASGKGSGNMLYDIYPGKPDQSILLYRMMSNEPDIQMPEIGRSIHHKEGVELIRQWIQSEKGDCI
ncbi:MAG TPA: SO2930 family diheme c-type cytochrome [Leptospiraceae bacterium]|nr:SO2930 family diheme c-type cytochrome [Leptospiraceae bacterium]HMW04522.1 SO2930 family diheme c-type cytochrome [Leptospiraceae bacterium]HMX31180.1 SO2930 family diheme c-type cytochrome [Leptospiraceae bacterium]HMY30708.1 SO2930 family diheme c-type cytochrome [Leptospiraceae bacterium]HMZ63223.1 SO2930 family diheme c-type cytochrome [Leptospiraceae bacterium]